MERINKIQIHRNNRSNEIDDDELSVCDFVSTTERFRFSGHQKIGGNEDLMGEDIFVVIVILFVLIYNRISILIYTKR